MTILELGFHVGFGKIKIKMDKRKQHTRSALPFQIGYNDVWGHYIVKLTFNAYYCEFKKC